ncbi:MAG: nucleotidyltransferase domain-containing protein [Anaerolineae bacterium]
MPIIPVIDSLVRDLSAIPGMQAVVLGGSLARGTAQPDSDVDLGLYYFEDAPFSIADVRRVVEGVSGERTPVVTEFYQWGPWVNGGAWIWTPAGKVDFLYRNIDHVRRVIADARAGKSMSDYYQQPPYGFHSVIYLGETQVCVPLYDPVGVVQALKQSVAEYPPALKTRIVDDALWGVRFTLEHADKFAHRGDVYNAAGCLTRVASNLTQALYALNEVYFISDKGAMAEIGRFSLRPADYPARLQAVLGAPGADVQALIASVEQMRELFNEVVALAGEMYRERYKL